MNKLCKRLLVFFIGLPLVLGLLFLDFANHLVFNFIIVSFSVLAAKEFVNFVPKDTILYISSSLMLFASPFVVTVSSFISIIL